ncbi:MAG: hypothetical protein FWD31_09820, partial [Planctomycetaceae bacterium]|nr:hypothetical protein [Planctomycetaceae bacterium]
RNDDFASVAFWYQVGQPKRFTTLPSAEERKLPNLDLIIEGKQLLEAAKFSNRASTFLQKGWPWTGDGQIFFRSSGTAGRFGSDSADDNAWLEVTFPVEKEELRQLTLRMTESFDYGIYRILLDGEVVRDHVDFYNEETKIRELSLGQLRLSPGQHTLRFECVGKRGESQGHFLGLDSVRLRERWNIKRTAPADVQIR